MHFCQSFYRLSSFLFFYVVFCFDRDEHLGYCLPVTKRAIKIKPGIRIAEDELVFRASRSSGPGGQNVNKLSTRITAIFDVANSRSLTDEQKEVILRRLATRVGKNGRIKVTSQRHRSQRANRQAATERLMDLLAAALETRPERKKTKKPRAADQRRLEEKKRRSILKRRRRKNISVEG
jgi:ribosome-associated protein